MSDNAYQTTREYHAGRAEVDSAAAAAGQKPKTDLMGTIGGIMNGLAGVGNIVQALTGAAQAGQAQPADNLKEKEKKTEEMHGFADGLMGELIKKVAESSVNNKASN